jgi:hypothetical protein
LSISSSLLQSSIPHWKVELTITTTRNGVDSSGSAYMIYHINKAPENGTCSVDKLSGYAAQTYFNITCVNWVDAKGTIVKYEYFGNFFFTLI